MCKMKFLAQVVQNLETQQIDKQTDSTENRTREWLEK